KYVQRPYQGNEREHLHRKDNGQHAPFPPKFRACDGISGNRTEEQRQDGRQNRHNRTVQKIFGKSWLIAFQGGSIVVGGERMWDERRWRSVDFWVDLYRGD